MRHVKTGYQLANELLIKLGVEKPEELSEAERFDRVMRHIVTVPKSHILRGDKMIPVKSLKRFQNFDGPEMTEDIEPAFDLVCQ